MTAAKLKQKARKSLPNLSKFAGDSVNTNSCSAGQAKQAKGNADKRKAGLINAAALAGGSGDTPWVTS